jgi:hypothetical protein
MTDSSFTNKLSVHDPELPREGERHIEFRIRQGLGQHGITLQASQFQSERWVNIVSVNEVNGKLQLGCHAYVQEYLWNRLSDDDTDVGDLKHDGDTDYPLVTFDQ